MKKWILTGLMAASLSACVGYVPDSAPYYGGVAPYYGSAFVPAYAGVYATGGYYPTYPYHHIYSHYNNGYWQNYRHGVQAVPRAQAGGGRPAGGRPVAGRPVR